MRGSFARSRARAPRALAVLLLAGAGGAAALLGACSPCAGVAECRGESRVSLTGQLVERATGRHVPGVRVEIVPAADGAAGAPTFAPVTATTDGDGFWHADGAAPEGELRVDVLVTPPRPHRAYAVRGLRVHASPQRGNGEVLGRWVVDPFVQFLGEIRSRRGPGVVPNSIVRFRRTGGVGVAPDSLTVISDDAGRFVLTMNADAVGEIVGDLLIATPGLTQGTWFRNTRLQVRYRDEPAQVDAVFPVGVWLTYTGEIYFRGTGALLANADVQFRRTGGIPITPSSFVTHADASGRFTLAPQPTGEGEVVGELSFVPPGATAPVVIPGVRLATYDSLETRLLRVGFGERLAYAGELQTRGTYARAPGVPVEFRRTGGIAITPAVLRATSDADGRFPLIAATTDTGFVVGDLTVDPDGPRRQTYGGVRLRTFASDELRFAQVWPVGDGIFYAGELFERGTGAHRAGVTAQFVRTGGVAITPATTTGTTDAAGRFLIAAAAAATGDVIGDVVVRGPGGFVSTVRGVRLATQRDETLRLGGVWGYGPSLLYAGEVLNSAGDRPVVGARVSFERTGGLDARPARLDATTDAFGRFPLHLAADVGGEVIGTLTIHPPAPWADVPIVIPDVHVPTFDGDEQRLLAVWRIPPPGP